MLSVNGNNASFLIKSVEGLNEVSPNTRGCASAPGAGNQGRRLACTGQNESNW